MDTPTVETLAGEFMSWAEVYYRRGDGTRTGHALNLRHALAPLVARYASRSLDSLRATEVRHVQSDLVALGLSRPTCNARMRHLRGFVRWSVARDHADAVSIARWSAVEPLKRGRTLAPEPPPVRPVRWSSVASANPHLPASIASAVAVQWWTGMRVGEVCRMHRREVLCSAGGKVLYRPRLHKTAHHGHERTIVLGPRSVEHLDLTRTSWLFPSSRGTPYSPRTYRQAIVRACDRAGIRRWTPLQLRHSAATRVRAVAGLDAARLLLGHRSVATTERYAEMDLAELVEVAARVA